MVGVKVRVAVRDRARGLVARGLVARGLVGIPMSSLW